MCGLIGVIGPQNAKNKSWAAHDAYNGLLTLQHRGQDAAGILSFDTANHRFFDKKDLGLISSVFNSDTISVLHGNIAIAHTRYATTGGNDVRDLQPLITGLPFGLGMVHNGNLVNYHELARTLTQQLHLQLLTTNDLEILLNLWCHFLQREGVPLHKSFDFDSAIKATEQIFEIVDGAYAVVGIMAGHGLFGFRDPQGIRPLVLGATDDGRYCLASETTALNFLGYQFVRDVAPGELILISPEGKIYNKIIPKIKDPAPCMFEWVYFAGAASTIEGRSVYASRLELGNVLAKKVLHALAENEIEVDIVSPVPETSRPSSIALAEAIARPYREAFIKSRYVQRSFILNTQEERERAVQLKLSPILSEIQGKSILLVDDSIVRGTTSRSIVALLRKCGAKRISLAITCPPIRHPCYYGIDFPDASVLVATDRNEQEIADWIGVDKVIYIDEHDLKHAIGKKKLCMGCIKGTYPTPIRGSEEFRKNRSAT
jgi:amidophosphoribosyltransferase